MALDPAGTAGAIVFKGGMRGEERCDRTERRSKDFSTSCLKRAKGPAAFEAMFRSLKKSLSERALGAEFYLHRGYANGETRPKSQSNHRNSTSPKTVNSVEGRAPLARSEHGKEQGIFISGPRCADLLVTLVEGFKAFHTITTVFTQARVQTCMVHLMRHTRQDAATTNSPPVRGSN